jgi:hypothetical protein
MCVLQELMHEVKTFLLALSGIICGIFRLSSFLFLFKCAYTAGVREETPEGSLTADEEGRKSLCLL